MPGAGPECSAKAGGGGDAAGVCQARPLRVVLIGSFRASGGEGLASVSRAIATGLAPTHRVLMVSPGDFRSPRVWFEVFRHRPDVVHYLVGPSLRGLVLLAMLGSLTGASTVCSLTRPFLTPAGRWIARWLVPDMVLTQAPRWMAAFSNWGARCEFLPNGVDLARFRPPSPALRARLRAQFGWEGSRVVLHVGHLRENRNLRGLIPLVASGWRVVVVGSPVLQEDPGLVRDLVRSGIEIHRGWVSSIEELYQAADCYVFPVPDLPEGDFPTRLDQVGVIDIPLSVLEASAVGVPVVSTRFGGLPLFLGDGVHCVFTEGDDLSSSVEVAVAAEELLSREAVTDLEWCKLTERLALIYRRLHPKAE